MRLDRSEIAAGAGEEIIDTRDRMIPVKQSGAEMRADESCAAGDDDVQCSLLRLS
jgi:hypothetical protein